jgi:hypothetical protein
VPTIPGAYFVWVPSASKVVHASEVYFDETLFPWRALGDRRVGLPAPVLAEPEESATALRSSQHGSSSFLSGRLIGVRPCRGL